MDGLRMALVVVFGLGGALVGWLYFLLMRYSLAGLGKGKPALRLAGKARVAKFVALALARAALFGCGLLGAILVSAWCLIAYTLGFIVARTVVVSRMTTAGSFSPPASEGRKHNG